MTPLKTIILLLLGQATAINAICQDTIKIELNNPAPRVGQSVQLNFDFNFIVDETQLNLDSSINVISESHPVFRETGRELMFTKPGNFKIGPYSYTINGKSYITNTLDVTVSPELPNEPGVWMLTCKSNNLQYLVLEQKVKKTKPKRVTLFTKRNRNEFEDYYSGYENKLTIINPESEAAPFLLDRTLSTTHQDAEYFYSRIIYIISPYSDESFSYTITEKDFYWIPEGVTIPTIEIKQ